MKNSFIFLAKFDTFLHDKKRFLAFDLLYSFIKVINSSCSLFIYSSVLPSNLAVILGPVLENLTSAHPSSNSTLTPSTSINLYPFSIQYSFTFATTSFFFISVEGIFTSGVEIYTGIFSNNSLTVLSVLDNISRSLAPL